MVYLMDPPTKKKNEIRWIPFKWKWNLIDLLRNKNKILWTFVQMKMKSHELSNRWKWNLVNLHTNQNEISWSFKQIKMKSRERSNKSKWNLVNLHTNKNKISWISVQIKMKSRPPSQINMKFIKNISWKLHLIFEGRNDLLGEECACLAWN